MIDTTVQKILDCLFEPPKEQSSLQGQFTQAQQHVTYDTFVKNLTALGLANEQALEIAQCIKRKTWARQFENKSGLGNVSISARQDSAEPLGIALYSGSEKQDLAIDNTLINEWREALTALLKANPEIAKVLERQPTSAPHTEEVHAVPA